MCMKASVEVLKLLTGSMAVTTCSLKMRLFQEVTDTYVKSQISCGPQQHGKLAIYAARMVKANEGLLQILDT